MFAKCNASEINEKMTLVNERMDSILDTDDPFMREIMDWILASRGKQLRPRLVLLSSSFGTWNESIIELAASLEVLHMASLVHDDIVDDSPTRRGRDSVYKRFGKHAAVYAGDYMVFAILSHLNHLAPTRLFHVYKMLNKMCNGELSQYENLFNTALTEEAYYKQIEGKTATLFQIACSVGASESGCDDQTIESLSDYGLNFGMMFQIQDDLLDVLGAKTMGKPTDSDIYAGIYTLPVIYALQHESNSGQLLHMLNDYHSNADKKLYEQIIATIYKTGGIEYSINRMFYYKNCAEHSISNLADTDEKSEMIRILDQICGMVRI